jgi:hypothetical protein
MLLFADSTSYFTLFFVFLGKENFERPSKVIGRIMWENHINTAENLEYFESRNINQWK